MIPKNIIKKECKNKKSSSSSTGSYTNESNEKYYVPASHHIRIIDFGGATYQDESHTEIINTRQYRAPEVILGKMIYYEGSCQWDEKSDIWSMACILVELYSGELFFPTHNNFEHLCLIEKAIGNFM
jgi:serine/threonine protein kinase